MNWHVHKGPFKYYVSMFLAFLGPPTYVSINSTVNQQKLPFSDPTHPLLCWRNTWMVPNCMPYFRDRTFWGCCGQVEVIFKLKEENEEFYNRLKLRTSTFDTFAPLYNRTKFKRAYQNKYSVAIYGRTKKIL